MILLLACVPRAQLDLVSRQLDLATEQLEATSLQIDALEDRAQQQDWIATAEQHVAWVERAELTALGLSFTVDDDHYTLTMYQAGPRGTVKAEVQRESHEATLTATQWLERGVPRYAEFTERVADTERGARIWLSDGDRVVAVDGYSTRHGSGELPTIDPGPLPAWATQLTGHTLKELDVLCQQSDADCTLSPVSGP